MRRLIAALALAAALAPGTWWRSSLPPPDERELLAITEIPVAGRSFGALELLGAWRLESGNRHFHGYSALAAMGDGTLLAASDRGDRLLFSPPGGPPRAPRFDFFAGVPAVAKKFADIEAMARDPASGRIWTALESANTVTRYEKDFTDAVTIAPPAMRDWPENGGPEAMARLADGRFVVLSEGDPALFAQGSPGLLFPGDPVEGTEAVSFRFRAPEGYSPVDAAQLPDGRVVILLRGFELGLPPRFTGKLVVADPARIEPGGEWPWLPVADLAPPLPMDNYEGMAIEPDGEGAVVLWLISDDNAMRFQRTLLLKFRWRPGE